MGHGGLIGKCLLNVDRALENMDAAVAVGRDLHAELSALIDEVPSGVQIWNPRAAVAVISASLSAFQPDAFCCFESHHGRGLHDDSAPTSKRSSTTRPKCG